METVKEPQMNFLTGAWRFIYSKTTRTHFIFAAAVAAVPAVTDVLVCWISGKNVANIGSSFLIRSFLWGFLASYAGKAWQLFFIFSAAVMELVWLNFIIFFGSPITSGDMMNIFRESADVFDLTYLRHVWFVFAVVLTTYGALAFFAWKAAAFRRPLSRIQGGGILCLIMALMPVLHAHQGEPLNHFRSSVTKASLYNAGLTFSYFFGKYLPDGITPSEIQYLPYSVHRTAPKSKNILLVFGESLASDHFPMFGYNRQTFPDLSKRMEREKTWRTAQGMSGGIGTATSTLWFFNGVREPANVAEFKRKTMTLFKLAKEAGYNTYYLSAQEGLLTMFIGTNWIDTMATKETEMLLFSRYKDEGLVKLMRNIDFSKGKNFVVVHMRSPHMPYEERYAGREAEFEKFKPTVNASNRYEYSINAYDNALLFTDHALNKIISVFDKKTNTADSTVYITSDHGQLHNYLGKYWGHNNMILEQAKVPFFVRTSRDLTLPPTVSHYEITKIIADDLGYVLDNPNEENGTFFLHGNNTDFAYPFIKYKIGKDGSVSKCFEENTADIKNADELKKCSP